MIRSEERNFYRVMLGGDRTRHRVLFAAPPPQTKLAPAERHEPNPNAIPNPQPQPPQQHCKTRRLKTALLWKAVLPGGSGDSRRKERRGGPHAPPRAVCGAPAANGSWHLRNGTNQTPTPYRTPRPSPPQQPRNSPPKVSAPMESRPSKRQRRLQAKGTTHSPQPRTPSPPKTTALHPPPTACKNPRPR